MMTSACKPAPIGFDRSYTAPLTAPRSRGGAMLFVGQKEPSLGEVMDDPITRRLMASDGVRMDHLLDLVATARASLRDQG